MKRFFIALILICASSTSAMSYAASCASAFETDAFIRIGEDPNLRPLALDWLKINQSASPQDEKFLRVTYLYLIFVADLLNHHEAPNRDPDVNPYLKFLKNLFEAKGKDVDTKTAIEATSRFLKRFMTGQGADLSKAVEMVDAVQRDLVPEMARLQITLALRSERIGARPESRAPVEVERAVVANTTAAEPARAVAEPEVSPEPAPVGTPIPRIDLVPNVQQDRPPEGEENPQTAQSSGTLETSALLKKINLFGSGQPVQSEEADAAKRDLPKNGSD